MNFKPSDKVVCINAVPGLGTLLGQYLYPNGFVVHGQVYVVEGVVTDTFSDGEYLCLFLVGKPAYHSPTERFVGWRAERFRKLEEIQAENKAKQEESAALKEAIELINLY